ncbi:putative porin [Blattabacterium sp. (Cryptocercus kyebangensis)]|uniref:putative porin n=1 Tax=Blattabacterium sp. (Cryptocercus kyebangensis) TaxID=298656 RepID=UPI001374EA3C|nr:putative porin [Blattabacterium sp. (Cryptocercus kyebangensis)]
MKIFIFPFLFFIFYIPFSVKSMGKESIMEKKILDLDIYHPISRDYKYWTEDNKKKINLDTNSLSIEKYYSHNFFRKDNFGFFKLKEKDLIIPNSYPEKNFSSYCNTIWLNNNHIPKMYFLNDIFFSRDKIRYFDVKTPISEIFYVNDSFQEKILGGLFSQNPNKKINYSIEYRNISLEEESNIELKKHHSLFLSTFNYKDSDSYHDKLIWGHFLYQNFYNKKKIKIPFWNTTDNPNFFFDTKNLFHKRLYISFFQKINPSWIKSKSGEKSIFLKGNMEYTKYFKSFFSSKEEFQNNTINLSYFKNESSLIFEIKKKLNIEIGAIYDRIHYQLFSFPNYFFDPVYENEKKNLNFNKIYLKTRINYFINNIFKINSYAKWMIYKNHLQISTQLDTNLWSKFQFLTKFSINNNISSDFINFYMFQKNGNCYNNQQYNNEISYTKSINFSFLSNKKLNISFNIYDINHPYQKDNPNLLYWKYIRSWNLKIRTIHDIWKFQFNNLILCQNQESNQLNFSIPNFLSRSTISYEDSYFNKELLVNTGFSIHYFNKFFHQYFSYPFDLFSFYLENECIPTQIGGAPFVDYFFNFKIFRTIFYGSIQNIGFSYKKKINNQKKKKKDYFLKVGILWNLFT